jgi:hypothetical protein
MLGVGFEKSSIECLVEIFGLGRQKQDMRVESSFFLTDSESDDTARKYADLA